MKKIKETDFRLSDPPELTETYEKNKRRAEERKQKHKHTATKSWGKQTNHFLPVPAASVILLNIYKTKERAKCQ